MMGQVFERVWLGGMVAVALALALPAVAISEEVPLKSYTGLCSEEQSVGFNWANGRWNLTRFQKENYIVKKVTDSKCRFAYGQEKPSTNPGCYIVKIQGNKSGERMWCSEVPMKDKNNSFNYIQISCDSFEFRTDGPFNMARLQSDLGTAKEKKKIFSEYPKSRPDYKDSISISVGNCARID